MPRLKFRGTFYQGDGLVITGPGIQDIPTEKKAKQLLRDFPRDWQIATPEDEEKEKAVASGDTIKGDHVPDAKALSGSPENKMQTPGQNK